METEILQRPGEALPKKNILEYLEATARRLPEKTAFADENGSLTFGELIKKAHAVGSFLLEKGITGEPVLCVYE